MTKYCWRCQDRVHPVLVRQTRSFQIDSVVAMLWRLTVIVHRHCETITIFERKESSTSRRWYLHTAFVRIDCCGAV